MHAANAIFKYVIHYVQFNLSGDLNQINRVKALCKSNKALHLYIFWTQVIEIFTSHFIYQIEF